MEEVISQPAGGAKKRIFWQRIKRKILKHVWLVRAGIIAGVALGIFLMVWLVNLLVGKSIFGTYFLLVRDFVFTPEGKIESFEGTTNILVLGKGGEGHEAPDLTDTIIYLSVTHKPQAAYLISIPRDIWIAQIRAKVNSAYYWGNVRQEGGGMVLAKSTVEEIVGQPIHYAIVIDFAAFKKVIDILGGVEVEVERSFVDEKYPIPGRENDECGGDKEFKCRYEKVTFEKGLRVMDGEAALKFVRSRNAQGEEGTDIAREARQQKVIAAIKNKVLSSEIALSPRKLLALFEVAKDHIETDMPAPAAAIVARRIFQAKNKISTYVVPENYLLNPPTSPRYDNLYVFIPQAGDWEEVHSWVGCIISGGLCE
ncbi:MAG: Cell envelope-related function transcriptional attenuator, LytR/CpsA family [Candidatus Woesebacteria bacterium GW2011_GWA1_45_8]|uniref:Cell envelope-related function transcriptional attenuator, LytR/CpsA family n=1 Tax=Candidatus Woesebacteria bacterium GW2011_GWA1_45_8 TaxID=1618559 RepID=A0A0G1Q3K0_9BACT|nr:MAG: Cell envelope-related function transcriptional attenuator, LytR/CpsA family [Candidatus Woesebacteria bacterium GW2011_GWA1_45_8]